MSASDHPPLRPVCCRSCPFQHLMKREEVVVLLEDWPDHDRRAGVLCEETVGGPACDEARCRGFHVNATRLGECDY